MLDYGRVRRGEVTLAELVAGLTAGDLRQLTNEMIDGQLALIAGCDDSAVTFEPQDPAANDRYAATAEETALAWTLGHVIVHVTASSEESAFLAAEMARGVLREGRSRYETPWPTVTTMAQCRARLEESRRLRLATLDVWPAAPHLDVTFTNPRTGTTLNAVSRFVAGLMHDAGHLEQVTDIVGQWRAAGAGSSSGK